MATAPEACETYRMAIIALKSALPMETCRASAGGVATLLFVPSHSDDTRFSKAIVVGNFILRLMGTLLMRRLLQLHAGFLTVL